MKKLGLISLVLVLGLALPLVGAYAQRKPEKPAAALPTPAPAHGNADYITAEQLRDYLTLVASDEMEGRDTPSRGLDTTARYIASQLSRWGVKPAGDAGSYFQHIAMKRNKVDSQQTRLEVNGQRFVYGDDFLVGSAVGSASGAVVFAGQGWVFKS